MGTEIVMGTEIAKSQITDVDPALGCLPFNGVDLPHADNLTTEDYGRAFYQIGKLYYDKSDLDKAEIEFNKAMNMAETPRDLFSVLKILGFLIRINSEKLEDEKATKYILKSEELLEELARALGTLGAEYFYNAGIISNYKGDFDDAKKLFVESYKRSKEENEPELLAKTLLALATNSYNRKDFGGALDYLSELNDLLKIIKKNYLSGAMYMFSARIYIELELYDNALKFFGMSNEILQTKNCWNLYGYILLGKGIVYKRMGDYSKALLLFNLAHESIDKNIFRRLSKLIQDEIEDVNDSSVDIYLDRTNRKVKEKDLGTIDFKHRFVLLEILFLLANNPGVYYDKEQLARMIWKDEYNPLIHDKLIYTSVSRLRKLIEPEDKDKSTRRKYIIRGKDGYTFNQLVKTRFHMESRVSMEKTIANVELSSPV